MLRSRPTSPVTGLHIPISLHLPMHCLQLIPLGLSSALVLMHILDSKPLFLFNITVWKRNQEALLFPSPAAVIGPRVNFVHNSIPQTNPASF